MAFVPLSFSWIVLIPIAAWPALQFRQSIVLSAVPDLPFSII
jgi:hypothetical protein